MNKNQKIEMARKMIDNIEEGDPYLIVSGVSEKTGLSVSDVCDLMAVPQRSRRGHLSSSCHYCGGPAVSFDFFDVPVCRDCGG